jgi:hypothetical protein
MSSAPRSTAGNTHWAEQYGHELKGIVKRYAARAPRSVQKSLGPSELGASCDRMIVAKMSAQKHTNNISDPWASIVGTAIHAYLEGAFSWDNIDQGYFRWLTEARVTPDPGPDPHPGTADLYDAYNRALVDHKCQSEGVRAKLIADGPKRAYFVQLLLYRQGYLNLGLPVDRIVLASWPRTKSSLDDLYVWEHTPVPEDEDLVRQVLADTQRRQALAQEVIARRLQIMDITPTPSDAECFYCPLYRVQSAYDGKYGCAGTLLKK